MLPISIKAKKAFKEGIGNKSFNNNTINVGGSPMMREADRSSTNMPTQEPFMRYVSPFPKKTSYNAPLNRNLKPVPEDNKGLAKLPTEVRNNMGFQRKNKFCGGMSKPYGKKK